MRMIVAKLGSETGLHRVLNKININVHSRQTLIANIIQQISAILLILILPNILGKSEYAQTVFVGMLLSFIIISDLGLSLVYGNIVPSLIGQKKYNLIRVWDASVLGFGLISTLVFAIIISVLYILKYENILFAVALFPLPIINYWISFHISRSTVKGNFSGYRDIISLRALTGLLCLPMTMQWGLSGWFLGQIIAGMGLMMILNKKLLEPLGTIDWQIMQKHIGEGLLLSLITGLWLQLLNFSRFYASLFYTSDITADYGVIGAANQSLSTLLISIFLPISVSILKKFGEDENLALNYVIQHLKRFIPLVILGTIIIIEIAPQVFSLIYPEFNINFWQFFSVLIGILYYPFFILWGNVYLGKRYIKSYLLIVLFAICVSFSTAYGVDMMIPGQGAGWGQLLGIILFPLMLILFAKRFSISPNVIQYSLWLYGTVSLFLLVYSVLHRCSES